MKARSKVAAGMLAAGVLLVAGMAAAAYGLREHLLGPEGRYFDSAGVSIHYTDEGAGVPVVLVHGLANPANLQWRRRGRIDALAKRYRVIALDNRGHGRSGKPHDPDAYGAEMAEDIVRLLDHLHIEKAHVAGYSMGGFIALKLVALHPDRLLSAAVCGAGWQLPTEENLRFAEDVAAAFERGELGPLPARLGLAQRSLSPLERAGVKLSLAYFNDGEALAALARAAPKLYVTEAELRANRVPVLTIIGGKDGLLSEAQALHAHMAHHTLVVLEDKNHMNVDVAGEFMRTLQDFIAEHSPREHADRSVPTLRRVAARPEDWSGPR